MRYLILVLAICGMIVSGLALKVHYDDPGKEPCSINDKWDCGVVNHSPYATIFGVPVAAIGIAGYLLLAVLGMARQKSLLLSFDAGGACIRAIPHQHREARSGGLVPVLRDLSGHHRNTGVAGNRLVCLFEDAPGTGLMRIQDRFR